MRSHRLFFYWPKISVRVMSVNVILWAVITAGCGQTKVEKPGYVYDLLKKVEKMREELAQAPNDAVREKIIYKVRKYVLKILDIHTIARLTLGKYYYKLSEDQKDDFFEYFEELMAHQVVMAHIPPGAVTSVNTQIEILEETKLRDHVFQQNAFVVRTRFSHASVYYNIDFYLHKVKKEFRLYDIHLDSASILLDYRKQFQSIIQRKGIDYLINKIKEKVNTLSISRSIF